MLVVAEVEEGEPGWQGEEGHGGDAAGHEHGGDEDLPLEYRPDLVGALDGGDVGGDERGDRAHQQATALMSSGYIIAAKLCSVPNDEMDATNSAAHDDSAYDPNRSDPMPAMSPTLSPTLSAITCITHMTWSARVEEHMNTMESSCLSILISHL